MIYGNSIYIVSGGNPLEGFTYSGDKNTSYIYDSSGNTCLALTGSGLFTAGHTGWIEVFMVGGGGGGGYGGRSASGSGTYFHAYTASGTAGTGGTTYFGTYSVPGGFGGVGSSGSSTSAVDVKGGNGGSGGGAGTAFYPSFVAGSGGSGGANGSAGRAVTGGIGQLYIGGYGYNTRAFGLANGNLFSGGGCGGYSYDNDESDVRYGSGGLGGGGGGATSGSPNTGGGGGARTFASDSRGSQYCGASGGGGGFTKTVTLKVFKSTPISVTIGAGGAGIQSYYDSTPYDIGPTGGSGIILIRPI